MFNGASPTYVVLENVGGLYLSRYGLQSSSMGYGGLIYKSLSFGILALYICNGHELRLSILQAPSYRCLFFVYHVLKVMLAPLFLRLFIFQLANLFHQLLLSVLHKPHHFNKEVGVISMVSLFLPQLSPQFRCSFSLS